MKTNEAIKKAIKFLEFLRNDDIEKYEENMSDYDIDEKDISKIKEQYDSIITLLKRGEAMEKVLSDLKNDDSRTEIFRKHLTYYEALVAIEQKYLKEAK